MVSFKHLFVSAKADGSDSSLVKPSDWNHEHNVIAAADGVVLGVPTGAGPSQPVQEMPISSVFPPGFVSTFAGATAPTGWLICDGSLHNSADLPGLFAAIGATYNIGGESASQFRIPDCRGRVIAGVDGGVGRLGAYIAPILGGSGGQEYESVFCDVSVSGPISVVVSGTMTGSIDSGSASAGGSSGGSNYATSGSPVTVSGALGGSQNNSMSGGGNTRNASNIQPMIIMNQMIKT